MNKKFSKFKNRPFRVALIGYCIAIILYHLYALYIVNSIKVLLPIGIHVSILFLIITKKHYLKIVLKVWSAFFLIILSTLQIVAKGAKFFLSNENVDVNNLVKPTLFLLIGIVIYHISNTIIITNDTPSSS